MNYDGQQGLLLNELSPKGWYEVFPVEFQIRQYAKDFKNLYQIGFFGCCRETFNPAVHTDCKGETLSAATQQFDEEEKQGKRLQYSENSYEFIDRYRKEVDNLRDLLKTASLV